MPPRCRKATVRVAPLAALGAALGCARAPPPDLSRDPAALLAQVRAAQTRVHRVRGNARVRVDSPGLKGSVDEFVAAEKPDRVRLETHDFFGNVAAVMVADGERFALLDARERVFYRGAPTPENVSKLLPVVIPPDELVTILCGSAPILPGDPVAVDPGEGVLLLTIAAGDTGQRLAIGDAAAVEWSRVRRLVPGPRGGTVEIAPAYDLDFGSFRRRAGARFPLDAALVAPPARVRIDLHWRESVEIDVPIEPSVFRLEPPKGVRVVDLSPGMRAPEVELPLRPGE